VLISLGEAQAYVLDRMSTLPAVELQRDAALGAVATADVVSGEAVPPFANSAMDGYAVRALDTIRAPVELTVIGTVAAGHVTDRRVGAGQAVRTMTGAPMPAGADAVVLVERTRTLGDIVTVQIAVDPGTSVREAGEDVHRGDVVVSAGTALTPAHLGVLASVGVERVMAYRIPRVGVLCTGDELVSRGPLRPGQIRNSNGPMMRALLRESGFDAVDLGAVTDDEELLASTIADAVVSCDAVVTTGGVSMGDLDYVKVVLARLGEMRWMQVAIKPAKPLAFGIVHDMPVFGLPGNPVSSMVSYELFARPALRRMAGHEDLYRPVVAAVAPEGLRRKRDGKTHFVRVAATHDDAGVWSVRSAGGQDSHQLAAMAAANALAVVPDGDDLPPGATVPILLLGRG
jgi:molybdopterin molybdotransferase